MSRFEDYIHREYGTRHGLPSNWIHDVLQTRDGYLWVATNNGVARFDGVGFTTFNRANTPQLPASDSRKLYESRDGTLWIGTIGGLVRYRGGRPGTFEQIDVLAGKSIMAIFEDSSGALWIGTRERTWRAKQDLCFAVVENAPSIVWAILEDRSGTMWLGSEWGLYKQESSGFVSTAQEALTLSKDPNAMHRQTAVYVLSEDDVGNLLIGTNHGLLIYKKGRFEFNPSGLGPYRVSEITRTRSGDMFVISGWALHRWKDGSFERLPEHESPTQCFAEDREGGLWVGKGGNGGLHYYRNNATSALFKDRRVFCVYEDQQGSVWFGSQVGLHRLEDGEITNFGVADGLPNAAVRTIGAGSGDTLWIGTSRGLARWSQGRAKVLMDPPSLADTNITAVYEDSAGVLWMAFIGRETRTLKDGVLNGVEELNRGNTHWFHEDSQGKVWIGHEYGLFQATADGVERINDPSFDRLIQHFHCHYAGADGTLWLGTPGGIARYRSGRFDVFTTQDGLAADYIQLLQADNHGDLWLGGRHGFFRVGIHQFDESVSG